MALLAIAVSLAGCSERSYLIESTETRLGSTLRDERRTISGVIDRAEGPRKWDVDGNEYIDSFSANGPLLLGHNHPALLEAKEEVRALGALPLNPAIMVECAELVQDVVPCAERGVGCAEEMVRTFGRRTFRRPLSEADVQRYLQVWELGTQDLPAGADPFAEGVRWTAPGGGPTLWLEVPRRVDLDAVVHALAARGVVIRHMDSAFLGRRHLHGFRLCFAQPTPQDLQRGLELLAAQIKEYL